MATKEQILANRRNGLMGGVKTPHGKAVSRLNARKHGIFASALTPEDAEELHGVNDQLAAGAPGAPGRATDTGVGVLAHEGEPA